MILTRDTFYLRVRPCSTMSGKYPPQICNHTQLENPRKRGYTRNEDVYPNPEVFDPDRFVNPAKPEVPLHVDAVWGFGRRVCPGKAFAEANLWLIMANTIAVMDIRRSLDENGNPITPTGEFEPGAIRYENA